MMIFAHDFSMPAADPRSCDVASWSTGGLRRSNIVLGLGIVLNKQETQAYTDPSKAFIA
jgi:hypothetical protein